MKRLFCFLSFAVATLLFVGCTTDDGETVVIDPEFTEFEH